MMQLTERFNITVVYLRNVHYDEIDLKLGFCETCILYFPYFFANFKNALYKIVNYTII